MCPIAQQECGAGVAQIMEADARQPCALQQRLKVSSGQVIATDRSTCGGTEDKILIPPGAANYESLLELTCPMATHCLERNVRKADLPTALRRLGRLKVPCI